VGSTMSGRRKTTTLRPGQFLRRRTHIRNVGTRAVPSSPTPPGGVRTEGNRFTPTAKPSLRETRIPSDLLTESPGIALTADIVRHSRSRQLLELLKLHSTPDTRGGPDHDPADRGTAGHRDPVPGACRLRWPPQGKVIADDAAERRHSRPANRRCSAAVDGDRPVRDRGGGSSVVDAPHHRRMEPRLLRRRKCRAGRRADARHCSLCYYIVWPHIIVRDGLLDHQLILLVARCRYPPSPRSVHPDGPGRCLSWPEDVPA